MRYLTSIIIRTVVCTFLVVNAAVSQSKAPRDTTFRPEQAADRLFRQLRQSMRELNTLSFKSEYRFGKLGEEPLTAKYTMWMKKPSQFRLEASSPEGKLTGVLLHDGKSLWEYWPERRPLSKLEDSATYARTSVHRYRQMNEPAKDFSIKKEAARLGPGIIWLVLDLAVFFEDSAAAYAVSVLKYDGAMIRGTETINGEPCTILERSFNDRYYRQTLWISQRDFVPRRLRDVITGSILEHWSDIKMNEPIPDDRFTWEPPPGWVQWYLPSLDNGLPKVGTQLPDFDLTLTTGERVTLAKFRGSIVLLNIWSLNCPPCRQEIPYLERVYSAYKDKGVIVLGLSSDGPRDFVEAFLTKNNVTYPNIMVRSDTEANFVRTKFNPAGAIPLNYVIDKQGRVADAWFGFEQDDNRIETALRKLGIK